MASGDGCRRATAAAGAMRGLPRVNAAPRNANAAAKITIKQNKTLMHFLCSQIIVYLITLNMAAGAFLLFYFHTKHGCRSIFKN